MNRNDEQMASKIQSKLEPLLAQEIWSHCIKIPPGPKQRWDQSGFQSRLFMSPTSNQNQEMLSYLVNPSELGEAIFCHYMQDCHWNNGLAE